MNLPNFRVGDFTVGQPCAIVYPTGHIDFAVFIEMRDDMPVFTVNTDKLVWVTLWEIFEAVQNVEAEISILGHLQTKEQRAAMIALIAEIRDAQGVPEYAKSRKGIMSDAEAEETLCWNPNFPSSEDVVRGLATTRRLVARIHKHRTGQWPKWAARLRLAEVVMRNRIHFRNLASPPAPVTQPEPVVAEKVLPPSRIVLPEAPPRVVKPTAPPVDCSRMTRDQLTAYLQKVLAECEMSEKN